MVHIVYFVVFDRVETVGADEIDVVNSLIVNPPSAEKQQHRLYIGKHETFQVVPRFAGVNRTLKHSCIRLMFSPKVLFAAYLAIPRPLRVQRSSR